jgi:hypothetical protein
MQPSSYRLSGMRSTARIFLAELAVIYARTGEIEKSIEGLERLLSIPSGLTENELRIEPWWIRCVITRGFRDSSNREVDDRGK